MRLLALVHIRSVPSVAFAQPYAISHFFANVPRYNNNAHTWSPRVHRPRRVLPPYAPKVA